MATVYKPTNTRVEFSQEDMKTLKKAYNILQTVESDLADMGLEFDSEDIDWVNFPNAERRLYYESIGETLASTLAGLDDMFLCTADVSEV